MSRAVLARLERGRFRVAGDLDFAGVAALVGESKQLFADGGDIYVDLADVAHANSAGLAIVLDWLARARREGRRLFLVNLPESMCRLAELSNLEDLIGSVPTGSTAGPRPTP